MDRVRYHIRDDGSVEEIHKIVVHTFRVGDSEDPDIYAAEPILDWEKGEAGKFVMKHAVGNSITWHRELDFVTYGHRYAIVAELPGPRATEYYLRWGT